MLSGRTATQLLYLYNKFHRVINLSLAFLILLWFYICHNIKYQAHVFCRPLEPLYLDFKLFIFVFFLSFLSLLSTETQEVTQVQSRRRDEQAESRNTVSYSFSLPQSKQHCDVPDFLILRSRDYHLTNCYLENIYI